MVTGIVVEQSCDCPQDSHDLYSIGPPSEEELLSLEGTKAAFFRAVPEMEKIEEFYLAMKHGYKELLREVRRFRKDPKKFDFYEYTHGGWMVSERYWHRSEIQDLSDQLAIDCDILDEGGEVE